MVLFGCSSSIPHEYVQKMSQLTVELEKTKNIANEAITKIEKLEDELSKSILERDSLLFEHKQETSLLRASDAFQKGNNALLTKNIIRQFYIIKKQSN